MADDVSADMPDVKYMSTKLLLHAVTWPEPAIKACEGSESFELHRLIVKVLVNKRNFAHEYDFKISHVHCRDAGRCGQLSNLKRVCWGTPVFHAPNTPHLLPQTITWFQRFP
jgi:hypothetical protein